MNPVRTARLVREALRHPIAAAHGAREFRSDVTRHYEDWDVGIAYDCGRELAHLVTRRRWDW